jgi:integrase/recombinase XerC
MPELEQAVASFIEHCEFERCLSKNTCENYQRDLKQWCQGIQNKPLNNISLHDIQQWIMRAHEAGKSPRSLARMLASLRSFFKYCCQQNWCELNPAVGVKTPKADKPLPKTLDVDQIAVLLKNPEDTPILVRDFAIMELFYSSGLRLSELVDVSLPDLDFQDGLLRVTGKGNKTRIVPVGKQALQQIKHWLKIREGWLKQATDALFISQRGDRLGNRAIQKRLQFWGEKLGLAGSLHPHKLRHSVASHLLESSGDLRAVQEFLGHANLSTTQIYTQLDFQHLASVYDQAHPRARKKKADSEE